MNRPFRTIDEMTNHFEGIKSQGRFSKLVDRISDSIGNRRVPLPVLATIAALPLAFGAGFALNKITREFEPPRTDLAHVLGSQYDSFDEGNIGTQNFIRSADYAAQNLPSLETQHPLLAVPEIQRFAKEHSLDTRLASAWLRASYLAGQSAHEAYTKEGQERGYPGFVPCSFTYLTTVDGTFALEQGAEYLKLCTLQPGSPRPEPSALDVFIKYFSTNEATMKAKRPIGDEARPFYEQYSYILPDHQESLINTATVLYALTDEDGKVHFDWIDRDKAYDSRVFYNTLDFKRDQWQSRQSKTGN